MDIEAVQAVWLSFPPAERPACPPATPLLTAWQNRERNAAAVDRAAEDPEGVADAAQLPPARDFLEAVTGNDPSAGHSEDGGTGSKESEGRWRAMQGTQTGRLGRRRSFPALSGKTWQRGPGRLGEDLDTMGLGFHLWRYGQRPARADAEAICEYLSALPSPERDGRSLLAAVVETIPPAGETDWKANTILPHGFALVRDLRSEQGTLFGELPDMARPGLAGAREHPDMFGSFPGFQPTGSALVPSLPLLLFDASGQLSEGRGPGAPLALRVWIECVLWGKPGERSAPRRLTCTLGQFIDALWPNGSYRKGQDGGRLLRTLHQVHNARVPWTDRKTGRPAGYWAAVVMRNMPRLDDRNSVLVFDVEAPPGAETGPMIHRPTLRKYGVLSAPAYRASLGLAYLWNKHLTHRGSRLPPTVPIVERDPCGVILDAQGRPLIGKGGKPARHWNDPRAVRTGDYERNPELERLPSLSPEDLLSLTFPEATLVTKPARDNALLRARKALRTMEANGDLVITEDGKRWRLEPPDWWGAPAGGGTPKRPRE